MYHARMRENGELSLCGRLHVEPERRGIIENLRAKCGELCFGLWKFFERFGAHNDEEGTLYGVENVLNEIGRVLLWIGAHYDKNQKIRTKCETDMILNSLTDFNPCIVMHFFAAEGDEFKEAEKCGESNVALRIKLEFNEQLHV